MSSNTAAVALRPWKYEPLPSADRFHRNLYHTFKGFSGPVGSGKSYAFGYEALLLAMRWNPGLMGLIGAPTYKVLRDATKRTFLEILEIEQIAYTPHTSENRITIHESGSEIIFRSLDDYEKLRGPNLAWFGVDELTYCKPEAWSRLEARLRHPQAHRLCGFAAWTPKGFDSVYEKFVGKPGPDYWAVLASARENHYVDRTGLYDRLAESYDKKLYQQEVLGEYLNVASGAVYYAFDRTQNLAPQMYNPLAPLCWALDFNVHPLCSVLAQMEDRTTRTDALMGRRFVRVNVLGEVVLGAGKNEYSHTAEACEEFVRRAREMTHGRNVHLRVYGDPAGSARSTAGKSDWQIVREYLGRCPDFQTSYHVPSAHPAVKDRVNAVNAMLCSSTGERRLFIDPGAQSLIKDFEQVCWKADGSGNLTGQIDKSDGQRTHSSDALGYFLEEEFGLKGTIGYQRERLF